MTPELSITAERIDDFPLLLATMQRLGLPEIVDRHLTRHCISLSQADAKQPDKQAPGAAITSGA